MRVLVACEFSGAVRHAFRMARHEAFSCDLLSAEDGSPFHIQGDVGDVLDQDWDLMIAHPPCTHIAVSGARWFKEKQAEQRVALDFVRVLLAAPIPRIALENPVSVIKHTHSTGRSDYPSMAVRTWGSQGDLSLAQEPAAPGADRHRDRPIRAGASGSARAGSVEEPQSDLSRDRGRDGGAVGIARDVPAH